MTWNLHHGDCREVLATLPDATFDAVVTDPPYGLSLMDKDWDKPTPNPTMVGHISPNWHEKGTHSRGYADNDNQAFQLWCQEWANEILRVLKPGGHFLAFGGTRTYHRLACAIEDAGFEIRDSIHWLYGSGFPKSLDVARSIEALTPGSPNSEQWQGWGTALKPAHEPVIVARKPFRGTVAANVLAHGTSALNIDGCRVPNSGATIPKVTGAGILCGTSDGWDAPWKSDPDAVARRQERADLAIEKANNLGRWPTNVILDSEAAAELDRQTGADGTGTSQFFFRADLTDDDVTSFRYVAKPNRSERNAGLDEQPDVQRPVHLQQLEAKRESEGKERVGDQTTKNFHPTVKPLDLIRWLVRLVTPPGGTVLDPFAGSGTTLAAALLEGCQPTGIELTDDYLPLIEGRCRWAEREARFGPIQGPTQVRKNANEPSLFDPENGPD